MMVNICLTIGALFKQLDEIKRDNNGQNIFDRQCLAQRTRRDKTRQ